MALSKIPMFFALVMALFGIGFAAVYEVGDSYGWTVKSVKYYQKWASTKNFTVGDALHFFYDRTENNVVEVDRRDFRSCNAKKGSRRLKRSGNNIYHMRKPGNLFFISTIDRHCRSGVKLHINVKSVPRHGPATSPSPAPSFSPKFAPTVAPTSAPKLAPISSPSLSPPSGPTTARKSPRPTSPKKWAPTPSPPLSPKSGPSSGPTTAPSYSPSASPKLAPTAGPTSAPQTAPASPPTESPKSAPSSSPSSSPTLPRAPSPPGLPDLVPVSVSAPPPKKNSASSVNYSIMPFLMVMSTIAYIVV